MRSSPLGRPTAVVLAAVFIVSLAAFSYQMWLSPQRPGVYTADGWYQYFDQSQYLNEAEALAKGQLPSAHSYRYGLGYPLLAAPLVKLGLGDPFSVPDALLFATSMVLVAAIGARLRSLTFGVVCAGAVIFATPLLASTVVPWSSSVTLLAVLATVFISTRPSIRGWDAVIVGGCAGMAFASRYADAVFPALIGGVALARSADRWRNLALAALVGSVIVAGVLFTHDRVLGSPWRTPYESHLDPGDKGGSDQDLRAYKLSRVPSAFWEVFVTGNDDGKRQLEDPIGRTFPWAAAAPLGLFALFRQRHELRRPMLVAAATSVAASAFYLSFRFTSGANLKFGLVHYFKAWFPVLALLAAYGLLWAFERLAKPWVQPAWPRSSEVHTPEQVGEQLDVTGAGAFEGEVLQAGAARGHQRVAHPGVGDHGVDGGGNRGR